METAFSMQAPCGVYFAWSTTALKASGWFMARSAKTFRFNSIPFLESAPIKVLYDMPCSRAPALIRMIHKDRN